MAITKGEWVVDDAGVDCVENMSDCLLNGEGTDDEWIAVGIEDGEGYSASLAYCHADNAHIIAAAPNLAVSVSELLARFELMSADLPDEQKADAESVITRAKYALLKAFPPKKEEPDA